MSRCGIFLLLIQALLPGESGNLFAETEKTIVLDEATISATVRESKENKKGVAPGGGLPLRAQPRLPTAFPWGREAEEGGADLSEEIFNILTKPDPSYWASEMTEREPKKSSKGE